jgi:hypothetical protein
MRLFGQNGLMDNPLTVGTETHAVQLTEREALVLGNMCMRERYVSCMFENPPDWDAMIAALLKAWPSIGEAYERRW